MEKQGFKYIGVGQGSGNIQMREELKTKQEVAATKTSD